MERRNVPETSADVLLRDGGIAVIRPLLRDDLDEVRELHVRASDDAIRLRFFSSGRLSALQYVDHLARDDGTLALVALVERRIVALASAEPLEPGSAEVAFLIDEDQRGRGLGSLLLEHLAAAARHRGVTHFVAEVLAENHAMIGVLMDAGFAVTRHTESGVVDIAMDTAVSPRALAAADERDSLAEASSLARLLRPRSVALVGVRSDGTGVGAAVLRQISAGGYRGDLHVVHPRADKILGVPTSRSFGEIAGRVDLAVLAVPANAAIHALHEAAEAGVAGVVVLSAGFGEVGPEGAAIQRRLLRSARDHGIRLIGPNCLGLVANDADTRLNATFTDVMPSPGGLAIASQSGGVGIVVLDTARARGLGVRSFVSLGNKADVSGNDLLAAWLEDPGVTAAALYLESFGNAPKFARLARRFAERKPLLAVVGGLSDSGRRAGASHTAAAASSKVGVETLFDHCGVIRCTGAEDLVETALILEQQPRPRGRRLGILSNAGGMGVLAADLAEEEGLVVPRLSPGLGESISAHVLGTSGTHNPVDAGAAAAPQAIANIAEDMLGSGQVDALLVVLVHTAVSDTSGSLGDLAAIRRHHPQVPVLAVVLGKEMHEEDAGITRFSSYASAVRALGRVVRHADWLAVTPEPPQSREIARALTIQARAAEALARGGQRDLWLDPDAADELLTPYGIHLAGKVVAGPQAASTAAQLGFPVAVKVADPTVVHRTERCLVRIGLTTRRQVVDAVERFQAETQQADVPVLVQSMESGVEMAVGLVRDPVFGPLVMVASGGVALDVWDDRVFMLAPPSPSEARRAVRRLKIWPLLAGHRGSEPCDVEALERLIVAAGRFADDVAQAAELDLNPVLVSPGGCAVVDLKLRLAPTSVDIDRATLRMLGGDSVSR